CLTVSLLQTWFKVSGIDIVSISFMSLIGQPYVYKFLWSPYLDRYSSPIFKFMDQRKGWILTTQLLIILNIMFMGRLDPKISPWILSALGLLLAFFSASQDLVIDAYKIEILDPDERGLGAAIGIEGYRLAMLVSGAGGLILADHLGWRQAYFIMACLMSIGVVGTLIAYDTNRTDSDSNINSNNGNKLGSDKKSIWFKLKSILVEMLIPLKQFLSKEKSGYFILLIILYKLGDVLSHSLTNQFLLDLNFSLTAIGTINKLVTLAASLIGVMLAGILMTKINLFQAMLFFGCLQAVTNLLYILLAIVGKDYYLAIAVFFLENLCGGMGTSALVALLMGLCDKQYSATQFALLSSIASIARIYVGPIAGILVKYLGWKIFYIYSTIAAIPGIILIICLRSKIIACDSRNNQFIFDKQEGLSINAEPTNA
ncbi:MAG: AmpG family muropeptide MFS transporter, partial [Gammaproteobacteria bacterium]